MASYLNHKEQSHYTYRSIRRNNGKVPKVKRSYSSAWVSGFSNVWNNEYRSNSYKNKFEKDGFIRGESFAKDVIKRK